MIGYSAGARHPRLGPVVDPRGANLRGGLRVFIRARDNAGEPNASKHDITDNQIQLRGGATYVHIRQGLHAGEPHRDRRSA